MAAVVSRYNATVTDAMLHGAREAYASRDGQADGLTIVDAPGAYELPTLVQAALDTGRYAGVLTLGCVIKGETSHDAHIASAVAQGLMRLALDTHTPVAFGVLTVNTLEQALARAGGDKGNKGAECMDALLDTIEAARALATDTPASLSARPDKASGVR